MNTIDAPGLIISTIDPSGDGVVRLSRVAQKMGINVTILDINRFENTTRYFRDYPDVPSLYRMGPVGYTVYERIIDSLPKGNSHRKMITSILCAYSKRCSDELLRSTELPLPRTRQLDTLKALNKSDIEYPCVVKKSVSTQGNDVHLVKSWVDMTALLKQIASGDYLLQEFIPDAAISDKRLFVVGDTVVASMKRTSAPGNYRANLHQGGTAVPYEPSGREKQIAIEATQALGLNFAGVDIVGPDDNPVILEVNPSPGFAIEDITQKSIAESVIKFVTRKV